MTPPVVIIPSRNVENLTVCVEAVRQNEPAVEILVVDDDLDHRRLMEYGRLAEHWGAGRFVQGAKPFVFARNVNLGIRQAARRPSGTYPDVVLLNDDALLRSPGGFTLMQQAAAADPELGLVSATTNVCSNPAQYQTTSGGVRIARTAPGFTFPAVAFVCVLIPARTLLEDGLLDERYTAYGWEDVDYCRRIHEAGKRIAIDDRCFVDHASLTSSYRGDPRAPGPIDEGRAIYLNKWGKA